MRERQQRVQKYGILADTGPTFKRNNVKTYAMFHDDGPESQDGTDSHLKRRKANLSNSNVKYSSPYMNTMENSTDSEKEKTLLKEKTKHLKDHRLSAAQKIEASLAQV